MKPFILFLFLSAVVTFAGIEEALDHLATGDPEVRESARQEIFSAFAAATAQGVPSSESLAIDTILSDRLNGDFSTADRLFLLRTLGRFGSTAVIPELEEFLSDEDPRLRDGARRALAHLGGEEVAKILLGGLAESSGDDRLGYLDALAFVGVPAAALPITRYLSNEDTEVVVSAALALGKLGNPAATESLVLSLPTAAEEAKPSIELALLAIGVDASRAERLVKTGSGPGVRAAAFASLVRDDPGKARELVEEVLGDPGFPTRLLLIQHAFAEGGEDVRNMLGTSLAEADPAARMVLVSAIGNAEADVFAPEVVALLPESTGNLRQTILWTLERIGGEESFGPVYREFLADSGDEAVSRTLARLRAPEMDSGVIRTLTDASADPADRIAAAKLLGIRSIEGATHALNRTLLAPDNSEELQRAVLDSLEKQGNAETLEILTAMVIGGGDMGRPAQIALRRLCTNSESSEYAWEAVFEPAFRATADDEARERLMLVLDAAPSEGALAYLEENLIADGTLQNTASRVLVRWPNLDAVEVWTAQALGEGADPETVLNAGRQISRMIGSDRVKGNDSARIRSGVKAIESVPDPAFKIEVYEAVEEVAEKREDRARNGFERLPDDPVVGERAREFLAN